MATTRGSQQKYPPELKERAVRLVFEAIEEAGGVRYGAVSKVAAELGLNKETLRNWVRQAEVDGGMRSGSTTADRKRIAELERENRELRRANEILRSASAYFAAAELDRRPRR